MSNDQHEAILERLMQVLPEVATPVERQELDGIVRRLAVLERWRNRREKRRAEAAAAAQLRVLVRRIVERLPREQLAFVAGERMP